MDAPIEGGRGARRPARAAAPSSIPGLELRRASFAHTRSLGTLVEKGTRMDDRAKTAPAAPQSLIEQVRAEAGAAPESGIVEVMKYGRGREGLIPLWAGEGDL